VTAQPAYRWDVFQGEQHLEHIRANSPREACAIFVSQVKEPGVVTVMSCPDDNDDIRVYRFKIERIPA